MKPRKRREPRPLPSMMLHIDGSKHQWFGDGYYYDLIVVMDDATNKIYYAQLVTDVRVANTAHPGLFPASARAQ